MRDIRGPGEWDGWGLKKRGYIQLSMSRVRCSDGEWHLRPVYPQLERAGVDSLQSEGECSSGKSAEKGGREVAVENVLGGAML